MTDAPPLSIQEASRRSGLSESTLRYYEKVGLIPPVPRDESSGHRRYGAPAVELLEALGCLRSTGMSVQDMRAYVDLLRGDEGSAGDDASAGKLRELFRRNAERVAAEIDRMQVRLRYLELKSQLWDARARGDDESEQRAVAEILRTVPDLR